MGRPSPMAWECDLSSQGLKFPICQRGSAARARLPEAWEQGQESSGTLPHLRDGEGPLPHDSQVGRDATEAVTRLLMPRVLRVPLRRPQVKAKN